ncbi:receptor-type tyrosine- phosphatase alpha isoform X3 [Paramuricea clavata]|uniref:protein-tyrosine-phosphatase n=1 Tax=Paramuricea clavata TaxID=317549 RepID=A0A6S7KIY2_PARCT|nr:receptor-type tyrosine- phosphatase alpha isoform X3 [Paramuricea clavata]
MVWEQEVSIIVMLTGLEEKGTVKCYQYWPVNTDEQKYGNLTLKLTGETVLADFTTRYFEMKEADTGQIRLVQHLHFTAWPDHGVPKYPGPLLHFHKRYRSGLSGPEPVVVHCSAGVGRTGTFIAVDYILHKLDEERNNDPAIDILHFVREMRGQRMFMVQTEEQYRFIHHAILEAVTFPDTEISSTDIRVRAAILRETLPGSNKTKGKEVFENLEKRILLEACEDGSSNDNQKKNRSKLLPFDYSRVHLNEMENSTDYINASYICGYQYPVNFIATQHPLPHTVSDFWRMVHEQKSAIILAISSKEEMDEFGSYWPEEGYASYGPINVGFEGKNEEFAASGFIVRNFKLTDTRDSVGRSFAVTHFNFVDWSPHNLPTASSMICLLAEVEKAQRKSQNTLVTVHCSDGGGRTGTFCAIVSCIERVKLENNIDLPMTLRNLHAQRKDMIQNEVSNFTLIQYLVVPGFNHS